MALSQLLSLSDLADPRENDYLLYSILTLYTTFVLKVGPTLMNKREAFSLRPILIAYNCLHIFLNGIIFLKGLRLLSNFNIFCTPVDLSKSATALSVLKMHHCYTLLKVFDLLDTVLYVLRKKNRQISFLHVYHHNIALFCSWMSCKYFPGGPFCFLIFVNSFVHIFMFIHYLLTAMNPVSVQNAWWKKYVTFLQIVQHYFLFVIFFLHLVNPNCSYPKGWAGFFSLNLGMMTYLFTKFYNQNYVKEKPKA